MPLFSHPSLARRYRQKPDDNYWQGKWKPLIISLVAPAVMLIALFLCLQAYFYGSTFKDTQRSHNLKVLVVDYDGGAIGQSVQAAYKQLQKDEFLGLKFASPSDYPTQQDVLETVCAGHYWGGVYIAANASERLNAALQGGQAAATYDPSTALGYYINGARYPTVAEGFIGAQLSQLGAVARVAYSKANGAAAMASVPANDAAAANVLLNPFQIKEIDLTPNSGAAGSRVLWNTAGQVLIILPNFFYMMALNGAAGGFQLYSHLPVHINCLMRAAVSLIFTFISSACASSMIHAFREGMALSGSQVVLIWMTLWLLQHTEFLIFDVATTWIPVKFIAMFVVTWAIISVTSTVFPFDLSPGFYRWAYALPTHNAYQIEIQIISKGCYNAVWLALPLMFTVWAIAFIAASFSVMYRCSQAAKADEDIAAAISMEKAAMKEAELNAAKSEGKDQKEQDELAQQVKTLVDQAIEDAQRAARGTYGPSIPFPFMTNIADIERNLGAEQQMRRSRTSRSSTTNRNSMLQHRDSQLERHEPYLNRHVTQRNSQIERGEFNHRGSAYFGPGVATTTNNRNSQVIAGVVTSPGNNRNSMHGTPF